MIDRFNVTMRIDNRKALERIPEIKWVDEGDDSGCEYTKGSQVSKVMPEVWGGVEPLMVM